MQHLTFVIYSSNNDHFKDYNILSYLKLHVEFEYSNRLEPNPTWDAVLNHMLTSECLSSSDI